MKSLHNFYDRAPMHDHTNVGLSGFSSTILVINCHAIVDGQLGKALCNLSYRLVETRDQEEGLRLAKLIRPELIIIGLNSPVNFELLCFQFKQCEKTNHIPIVILTQQDDCSNRAKSFSLGVDDFMRLPSEAAELPVRIQNLIHSRRTLIKKFSRLSNLTPRPIEAPSEDDLLIQRIMKIIDQRMADPLFGAEQFARELGLSQKKLYRKLTTLTGYSSNDFIRRMRLQRAADLLEKQVGNVSEVAYKVGFNNLSYFSKCFKLYHNSSPSDYKKEQGQ